MIIWLVVLYTLVVYKSELTKFNNDYIGRDETAAIKGFFIAIVFLSHLRGYIPVEGTQLNTFYNQVFLTIGQLMVTLFLFYSGYGCYESYKIKDSYYKTFPKNRILKTILHLDIALLIYVAMNLIVGIQYPAKNYLCCWIGWESIGNSNWYIFTVIALYVASWIGFVLCTRKKQLCPFLVFVLSIAIVFALKKAGKESWWYDTAICFPLGMIYSLIKNKSEKYLNHFYIYYPTLAISVIIFILLYNTKGLLAFLACSCSFCFIVVLITMKVKISNPVLIWMGNHLFEIYIFQRIPMTLLRYSSILVEHKCLFTALAIVLTMIIALVFRKAYKKIDGVLFTPLGNESNNG